MVGPSTPLLSGQARRRRTLLVRWSETGERNDADEAFSTAD
jgi:hypothetical protein